MHVPSQRAISRSKTTVSRAVHRRSLCSGRNGRRNGSWDSHWQVAVVASSASTSARINHSSCRQVAYPAIKTLNQFWQETCVKKLLFLLSLDSWKQKAARRPHYNHSQMYSQNIFKNKPFKQKRFNRPATIEPLPQKYQLTSC